MKTNEKQVTLYVSQYGDRFYAYTLKQLREKLGGRCQRMFQDGPNGEIYHVGYVIGPLWLTAYAPLVKSI